MELEASSSGIDFGLRGLATELKDKRLAVPFFQRSYAWTAENVLEFWSDLNNAISTPSVSYFIGTVVLTSEGTAGRDTVIDGQQRLATTAILLAAIRDEYSDRGDEERAKIVQQEYLSTKDLATATDSPKLSLNSEDNVFFEQRIVLANKSMAASKPSHELIEGSYGILRKEVTELATASGPAWPTQLHRWVEFLRTNLKAMILKVPDEADAFLVFETLNDRGADLTIADLLKNYLFGHAAERLDNVRDTWMQVLGALSITAENALFTTFLRHYWSSRNGAVRERELYRSIKDNVSSPPQVSRFVDDLLKAAHIYAAILSSDHEYWDSLGPTVKKNMETLLRLDLEQNRPLLLAALQHFPKTEVRKLLLSLVAWSVRGLIVGGIGGGATETAYCRAASRIRSGDIKDTADLLKELSPRIARDDEFQEAFRTARLMRGVLARYYLLALEKAANGDSQAELVPNDNYDEVNLEHVLPLNARDADWGAKFSTDERRDWALRLGNMALLKKDANSRIGNKPFKVKKSILQKSKLKLTSEIGSATDWTKQSIEARQKRLADLAIQVWPR